MCGRYLLKRAELKALAEQLALEMKRERATRYNIAPGTPIDVVRRNQASGKPELAELRWGFLPAWTAPDRPRSAHVNARAEGLARKPVFRDAFCSRRCALPASGFYEWRRVGRDRQPWLFELDGGQPFFLAGIWEPALDRQNEALDTCAIITTAANDCVKPIHERMPVMLLEDQIDEWLAAEPLAPARATALTQPFSRATMRSRPLSSRINSVEHDDAECLAPASELPAPAEQLGLQL